MNIKNIKEMSQLEKSVLYMIWNDVKNTKDDNRWRNYERDFTYEHQQYTVKCAFKLDNQYLTWKNFSIEYKVKIIDIPQGGIH
jgi:hypothetical protein